VIIAVAGADTELTSANDNTTLLVGVVNDVSNMFSLVGSSNFFPEKIIIGYT
jgi:hypothetical protein